MPTQSENQIREWLEECQQNDVDPSKQEFGTAGKLIKSGAGKAWNFVKDNHVYSWKVYVLPELSIVKLSKTYFFSKVNYCFSVIENNLENYRNEGGVNVFLRVWSILGSCYFSKDSFNKLDWSFNP